MHSESFSLQSIHGLQQNIPSIIDCDDGRDAAYQCVYFRMTKNQNNQLDEAM